MSDTCTCTEDYPCPLKKGWEGRRCEKKELSDALDALKNNLKRSDLAYYCDPTADEIRDRLHDLNRISWDDFYMVQALWQRVRSHDPNTQHGAIICSDKYKPISAGYNGFPRGALDFRLPHTRPDKYSVILHAEENAILNATESLEGAILYVTGFPCTHCWGIIKQKGIGRVVYGPVTSTMVNTKSQELSRHLHLGIRVEQWSGDIGKIRDQLAKLDRMLVEKFVH